MRFLLDENLSYETADFLNALGHDAKTAAEFGLGGVPDEKVIEKAVKERRTVITHDLDFGEIFYFASDKKLSVIILRLKDQTIESVNKTLERVLNLRLLKQTKLESRLILVEEDKIRIRRKI